MGNALLLWTNIIRFKENKDPIVLVSKAYLLCQKFINEGCYMNVDCIPFSVKSNLSQKAASAIEGMKVEEGEVST